MELNNLIGPHTKGRTPFVSVEERNSAGYFFKTNKQTKTGANNSASGTEKSSVSVRCRGKKSDPAGYRALEEV